jgi:hypothetical protein
LIFKNYYPNLEYSNAYFFKDTDTNLNRYGEPIFEIAGKRPFPCPDPGGLPMNIVDPAHCLRILR